jgi:AmmeMemoRadiSam system protein A
MKETELNSLVQLAGLAISHTASGGADPRRPTSAIEILKSAVDILPHNGVFVTIYVDEKLRGCIGVLDPALPLGDAVIRAAGDAASRDLRFEPLQSTELKLMRFEVTLLEPMSPFISPAEIEIGKHGIIVEKGMRRGLLLPKVAAEQGWNQEQFLCAACRKAGLPDYAWRQPETRLHRFGAVVLTGMEKNGIAPAEETS